MHLRNRLSLLARAYRMYAPLVEHTGLFLTFSALDPSDEEILAFANQFGLLREPQPVTVDDASSGTYGEPVEDWVDEIVLMKRAVPCRFGKGCPPRMMLGWRLTSGGLIARRWCTRPIRIVHAPRSPRTW